MSARNPAIQAQGNALSRTAGSAAARLSRKDKTTSITARQQSGMPMTSGKSAAFHCQPFAAKAAYPASSAMPIASASEALLATGAPAHLEEGVEHHCQRDDDQNHRHRARQPRRL